jgi:hypothetical protein
MSHNAPDSIVCHNCGADLHGAYCAKCGQQALPLNPRLRDFLHDLTHEVLHVDGKIFRSIRKLLLSPGFLTREQIEGRRARWIPPIRLYLIFSVTYFALTSLLPAGGLHVELKNTGTQDQETVSGLRSLGFENERDLQEAVSHAQATWTPRIMFLLVPFYAWLVQLATRRASRNFLQHLYFALHVHAAWFAAGALVAAAQWGTPFVLAKGVEILALLYGTAYAVIAFRRVYAVTIGQALLRTGGILIVYFLAVLMSVATIVVPVILGRR